MEAGGPENLVLKRNITGGIVTYNNAGTIEKCISSILSVTKDLGDDFKLYVYDNASTDGTADLVAEKYPQIELIRGKENLGFGSGHNEIMKELQSDVHFVINPDITLSQEVFTKLADELLADESIGQITPKVMNTDGSEQCLPKYCPSIRTSFIGNLPGFSYIRREYTRASHVFTGPEEIQFCTGCFFGIRTNYYKELKGFSPEFFLYLEDTDLSKRVLASGKKIIFEPRVSVTHDWKRENTRKLQGILRYLKSLHTFFKKWGFAWR